MKHYRITVNGKTYEVTVEDLNRPGHGSGAAAVSQAPAAVSSASLPAAPSVQPAAAPSNGETVITVKSPMPGTVLAFKVIVGQQVKRGDVLLLLEAMKMENEIVAPQDGTVVALRVPASASVNTGDPLVDLA
ncbi:MAG: biotin/lipoyl-containing protein [Rectinema subterraneum]|uniref:biotin/lipoyl-containing protein n=1 Tax=Rectinema subterraneum TaxID=2653714 RepID=UPI00131BDAC4|nr:biotin/lipoyl-containing protein [Rectinema subterraneum]